jgi:hypothetical protein
MGMGGGAKLDNSAKNILLDLVFDALINHLRQNGCSK